MTNPQDLKVYMDKFTVPLPAGFKVTEDLRVISTVMLDALIEEARSEGYQYGMQEAAKIVNNQFDVRK